MDINPSTAELLSEIYNILQQGIAAGIPGLSATICTAKMHRTFTAGQTNVSTHESIKPTHLFGIGSITKVFVAVVMLQLVEEQKIRLSDTVGSHLNKDIHHDIVSAESATIAQLLSHEAGIDSWEDDANWIQHGRGSKLDPSHVWGKTEPLEYIRRPKVSAPNPGQWYYSNTNYTLLGLIIEKVTHATAEAEVRHRILEPLGLQHIFFEGFEKPPSQEGTTTAGRYHWATSTFRDVAGVNLAFPEVGENLVDCSSSNLSVEWTAGGLLSSASDLARFAGALRDGKLLSQESLAILKEWRQTTGPAEMGHGLFRMKEPYGDGDSMWLGHSGGVLGYTSGMWWAEDSDCIVTILSNVGTMHSGVVPASVGSIISNTKLLHLAGLVAKS